MSEYKEYVSLKSIKAKDDNQLGVDGYTIQYPNYKSFCPKNIFNVLYREITDTISNEYLSKLINHIEIDNNSNAIMELTNGYKISIPINGLNFLDDSDNELIRNKLYDKLREHLDFVNYCAKNRLIMR